MSTPWPDTETVRSAIALATRAPSVHNTQPWRWLIGDRSVHLFADWTRQVPVIDRDGRDLLISCGAALHHLRIALAALGWTTKVHRLPNPAGPSHLAAVELRPHVPSKEDIMLADAIPRRRTDRRRFSSWLVPKEHLELMAERANGAGALLVPVVDPLSRFELTGAIAQAAVIQECDPDYRVELAIWSGRGRSAADGGTAANVPAGHPSYGDIPMRAFPGGTLAQPPAARRYEERADLLVLATSGDDLLSRLRAGEAASAALLMATELGLASCLLSQALEVADARRKVRDDVLDGTATPQLILRVGWAPVSAKPIYRSPRRPLDEVVSFLPGCEGD